MTIEPSRALAAKYLSKKLLMSPSFKKNLTYQIVVKIITIIWFLMNNCNSSPYALNIILTRSLSNGSVISDYSPYSAPISKAKYPHSHIKFSKLLSRYSQISSWSYPIIRDITTI